MTASRDTAADFVAHWQRESARLTEAGAHLIDKAPTPLQDSFVRKFDRLQSWEQHMIISSLQRVAEMMDAEDIDASPYLDIGSLDRTIEKDSPAEKG